MAIPSSATATMRGAHRCGVLVSWRKRWARCSRSGIAGMCLMRRQGCTICGVGTIIRVVDGLLMRIRLSQRSRKAASTICFPTVETL